MTKYNIYSTELSLTETMIDIFLFIYSSCLCFTGFVFALYGPLADEMVGIETKKGMEKGISFSNDEGAEYYARKFEKWNIGLIFRTKDFVFFGFFICIVASIINLVTNAWWSSLLVILMGYILYSLVSNILGFRVQLLSLIVGMISVILIISNLLTN